MIYTQVLSSSAAGTFSPLESLPTPENQHQVRKPAVEYRAGFRLCVRYDLRKRPIGNANRQLGVAFRPAPAMHDTDPSTSRKRVMAVSLGRSPWNKGKLIGQKAPFKLKEIWAIRVRLQLGKRDRELALLNLGIDSDRTQLSPRDRVLTPAPTELTR